MERGGTDEDEIVITVRANILPVADAGKDQTVWAGDHVNFDASSSYDTDGDIVKYSWDFDVKQSTVNNLKKKLKILEDKYREAKEKLKMKELVEGRKEPEIKEKIVRVTDTKTVNALREKRDKLQKKAQELRVRLKELNKIKNALETKKLKEYAILVKYNNDEKKFEIEKINLSEFNTYMRDERAFCRSKEIPPDTPYCVIQVWTDVF
jgi:hypothetical protein